MCDNGPPTGLVTLLRILSAASNRPARSADIDFSADTDAELLGYMAMQNDQPEGAREAFSEFYRRHAPWLLTTVRKSHAPRLLHGDDDALHDVVLDTMQLAYKRAETFELGSIPDPEHIRRRVRAWLGGIANNVVEDAVNALHSVPTPDPEDDIGQTILDTDDPEVSELAKRLEKEIEGLPEREQDILRTLDSLHQAWGGESTRPQWCSRSARSEAQHDSGEYPEDSESSHCRHPREA